MTPAAAKLLMCICAGSTGAVMVPATQKVRAAMKPRPAVHRVAARATSAANSIAAVPCTALTSIALGDGSTGLASVGFTNLDGGDAVSSPGFATGVPGSAGTGGGGGGGTLLPLAVPPAGQPSLPNTSSAPEVTTWSMMVVGAGVVGGTMRWRRREQTA